MKVIIPQSTRNQQETDWQAGLRDLFTDPYTLLSFLEIPAEQLDIEINKSFPLRITRSFAARMKKGDPHDPLLRQVLTVASESQPTIFSEDDPLQEAQFNPLPGLLHKFPNRVLLTFTGSCAIHCRYCFRRSFPYEKNNPGRNGWLAALAYIAERPQIVEVILSGGDPLMAQDDVIAHFLQELSLIPHVKLLRFHTRLPVVLPSRIQSKFISVLQQTRFITTMVYHINHPNELTAEIQQGVERLKQIGVNVFNQAVLLKDINDNFTTLQELSFALYAHGILPYYVNLLDPVKGTEHFAVSKDLARELQNQLRANLPGYLVPKFVQEIPFSKNKVPV